MIIDAIFRVLHDTHMLGVLRGFLMLRVKNNVSNKEHESNRGKNVKNGGKRAGNKHVGNLSVDSESGGASQPHQ